MYCFIIPTYIFSGQRLHSCLIVKWVWVKVNNLIFNSSAKLEPSLLLYGLSWWERIFLHAETQVQPLGWEDPLEEGMATHSSILTWRIPWTEETESPSQRHVSYFKENKSTLKSPHQQRHGWGRGHRNGFLGQHVELGRLVDWGASCMKVATFSATDLLPDYKKDNVKTPKAHYSTKLDWKIQAGKNSY